MNSTVVAHVHCLTYSFVRSFFPFVRVIHTEDVRERSATYLQQLYRRRLMQRRYRAMQAATAAWRKRHAAELVLIVQRELDRQRRIKLKVQQLTTMQNMRLCQVSMENCRG